MTLNQKIAFIQASIGGLKKEGLNPHFKNTYVNLNQVIEALTPLLTEQNLLLTMPLTNVSSRPAISLTIAETDEENQETIVETMTLPDLQDPQKMGSAITYYRRYMLMSFFNLKAEDDDGNEASNYIKPTGMKVEKNKVVKLSDDEYEY